MLSESSKRAKFPSGSLFSVAAEADQPAYLRKICPIYTCLLILNDEEANHSPLLQRVLYTVLVYPCGQDETYKDELKQYEKLSNFSENRKLNFHTNEIC